MAALTSPSILPIHSRYTGTSLCSTGTTSTWGSDGDPAAEVAFVQLVAAKAAPIETTTAQILSLLWNAIFNFVSSVVLLPDAPTSTLCAWATRLQSAHRGDVHTRHTRPDDLPVISSTSACIATPLATRRAPA